MKTLIRIFANANILLGLALVLAPVAYLVVTSTPDIWYRINPNALEDEIRALTKEPFEVSLADFSQDTEDEIPLISAEPLFDPNLPKGRFIEIPSIGVSTQIVEGADERSALDKGVWLMPEYGTPQDDLTMPTVLAAHRFGRLGIDPGYRNQHMFVNLPALRPGDTVIINWDQHQYKYKISYAEENTYVSRLDDLILITCKFIDSPDRIIVYGERFV